jgi:ribosomal protein L22
MSDSPAPTPQNNDAPPPPAAEENTPPPPVDGESAGEDNNVEPWRKVKHKFKAMGEVHEVDYDELVRKAEKGVGAEKRLAEATRKEREIMGKIDRLKTVDDFNEVVDLLGGDERARPLLEKFLWDKIKREEEEARLTPTERDARKRAEQAEREASEAKRKLEELDKAAEEKNKAVVSQKANEIINAEIEEAIAEAEKAGLSPEDVPYMVEQLIQGMLVHLEYLEDCEEAGLAPTKSPLSPRDVLRKIQDTDTKRAQSWLKKLSAKDLKTILSPEQLEDLRKSEIEAFVQPSTQNRATASRQKQKLDTPIDPFAQEKADRKAARKRPNSKDWFGAADKYYGLR